MLSPLWSAGRVEMPLWSACHVEMPLRDAAATVVNMFVPSTETLSKNNELHLLISFHGEEQAMG
jgi:hypothetical protein